MLAWLSKALPVSMQCHLHFHISPTGTLGTDHVDTTSEAKIDLILHGHDIAHRQNKFNSIGKTEVMRGMIQNEVKY